MEESSWITTKLNKSACDFVIDTVREALIQKKLRPGDKLPSEAELAASMQVSRSTIREAMKVLSACGVVDIRRGNGTFICESGSQVSMDSVLFSFLLSQPTVKEQQEFRAYMERIVMELVIRNATEDQIALLEENYAQLLKVSEDRELSTQNEMEFHALLGNFTGNRLISRVYMLSLSYFKSSIASTHKNLGGEGAIRIHRITIDAIKNRDMSMIDIVTNENIKTWMTHSDKYFFE